MKTRIVTTFGLALVMFAGLFATMLALGVLDAKSVLAVTSVQGEVDPTDPGVISKFTVKWVNDTVDSNGTGVDLDGGIDSFTIKPEDDMQIPAVIDPSTVTITTTRFSNNQTVGGAATGTVVANPLGITVRFVGTPKDNPEIEVEIPDMEPSTATPGFQGIAGPCATIVANTECDAVTTVTVVFRQGAGIENATEAEAGFDADGKIKGRDLTVVASNDTTGSSATAANKIFIPRIIELSDNSDKRGKVISVVGKGFEGGTTATIWRDEDGDGTRDAGEVDLGQALVGGDDTFTLSLTISVPPFDNTGGDNYINAVDGDQNTISLAAGGLTRALPISGSSLTQALDEFTLEGGFTIVPNTAAIGDTVQITIKDFIAQAWTKTVIGTSTVTAVTGAPEITLGGVLVNTPAVTPNSNGEATFNVDIPNGVPSGSQQFLINAKSTYAVNNPDKNITISGAGLVLTPETNLVPNQTITVIGNGFSSGSTISASATDSSSVLIDGSFIGLKSPDSTSTQENMDKINEGASVTTDNGGNWSSSIILPVNDATTTPGTHELKITDLAGRQGVVTLEIAARTLVLSPLESRVGTTVNVNGTGFPADNTKTGAESTASVSIKYTVSGTAQTVATLTPDASGNISGSFTVPLNAGIPSTNSVTAEFSYTITGASSATTNVTGVSHEIPRATVSIEPKAGPTGTSVTIVGEGFKTYSTLSELELGGIDVRPAPVPSTNSEGSFTTTVIVPQSNSGSQSVTATVASTVATDTFTVTKLAATATPSPVIASEAPEVALAPLIANNDNLQRVWHFDPSEQSVAPDFGWFLYDPRPVFAAANSVELIAGGKFYWINVREAQTALLGGSSRPMFAGWNPVTW
jgi:hypothetical protein